MSTDQMTHSPLTILSDDEAMFRDAVAGFANEEVRPRVQQMERDGKIDPALITKFFEMGLMGIEVPDEYGGAGGSCFMVALAVEEISKVDPAAAILMDVQNTLVNYPIRRYGSDDIKSTYLPQLTGEKVGAYALSEPGSGSDAFGMQTRAEQRGDTLDSQRPQDVDHERRRGADLRRVRERESVGGLQGHHGVHRRARIQGIRRRQEGGQARHPRVEHDGADPRRRRSARRRTCSAPWARATRSRSRR